MTTNHPEKLDDALIRPGRVEHQVAFSNATQTQIKELFERMYSNDLPRTKLILSSPQSSTKALPTIVEDEKKPLSNGLAISNGKAYTLTPPDTPITATSVTPEENGKMVTNGHAKTSIEKPTTQADISESELHEIAQKFAHQIPNDMFSPAEIQGFLLKRKKDPRRALEEVGVWVEGMVDVKRKGGKLVSVQ
jgi:chaperone BCS1